MRKKQKIECLLCQEIAELKHNNYPGYQEPYTFDIYYCSFCNTSFSLPRVETSEIYENIYNNGSKIPGYDRYWEYAQKVKDSKNPLKYLAKAEEIYWGVKEALSLYVNDKKSTSILEIGSGLGYLTYSLIKENYKVIGLDISQTAVKNATEKFGDYFICANLYEYVKLNVNSFDVVILTEVIEHIEKPLIFVESVLKLLKPDGIAIITTPNKSLFPSSITWVSDLPPVHCWWLSEESMRYITNKIGVKINFIKFDKYYQKQYRMINLKFYLDYQPQPIFNKYGEFISRYKNKNNFKLRFKLLIGRIPYLKMIYGNFKMIYGRLNKNIIVCRSRGMILCAIVQKKD